MSQPTPTVVAGSNGCGKSTLSASARSMFQEVPILDPDATAKSLQETSVARVSDMEAGRQVLLRAERLLRLRQSFTVETTLSGSTYLRMALRAQALSFHLLCILVGTDSVEINIERVKARVLKGGHNIAEADQRRRYPRTLANMKRRLPMADLAVLIDNSGEAYEVVASGRRGDIHWRNPVPHWAASIRS